MKKLLAFLLSLLVTTTCAIAQPSGGPGPTPGPWSKNGQSILPTVPSDCVTFPGSVTGGCKGNGTVNFQSPFIGGVATGFFATGTDAGHLTGTVPLAILPILNLSTCGAVGDDSADDTTAVQTCLNLIAGGGTLMVPANKKYKITGTLTLTVASGRSASVQGQGPSPDSQTFDFTAGQGITVSYGNQFSSFSAVNIALTTRGAGTGNAAISLSLSSNNGDPANGAQSTFYNVAIHGSDGYAGSDYWSKGYSVNLVSNVNWIGGIITGHGVSGGGGIGVSLVGNPGLTLYGVAYNFQQTTFEYLTTGIQYGSYIQGVTLNQVNMTSGTTGITTSTASSGILVGLGVINSQFGVIGSVLDTTARAISSSLILTGNIIEVFQNQTSAIINSAGFTITSNQFQGITGDTSGNNTAISVLASSGNGSIDSNLMGALNTAVRLNSSAANIQVGGSNIYVAVTNNETGACASCWIGYQNLAGTVYLNGHPFASGDGTGTSIYNGDGSAFAFVSISSLNALRADTTVIQSKNGLSTFAEFQTGTNTLSGELAANATATGTTTQRSLQDHFGDMRSVRDYGAKCDWNGTSGTDDTAAFSTALASGGGIYIPAGASCLLNGTPTAPTVPVTLHGTQGQSFLVINHGTTPGLSFAPSSIGYEIKIDGVGFVCQFSTGPCPLGIQIVYAQTPSFPNPTATIRDLTFFSNLGNTSPPYAQTWGRGLKMVNAWNLFIDNITGYSSFIAVDTGNTGFLELAGGPECNSDSSGSGACYASIAAKISNVLWYFGSDGIRMSGYTEGMIATNNQWINTNRGMWMPSTTKLGGFAGINRGLAIWVLGGDSATYTSAFDYDTIQGAVVSGFDAGSIPGGSNWTAYNLSHVTYSRFENNDIECGALSGSTGFKGTNGSANVNVLGNLIFNCQANNISLDSSTSRFIYDNNWQTGTGADTQSIAGTVHTGHFKSDTGDMFVISGEGLTSVMPGINGRFSMGTSDTSQARLSILENNGGFTALHVEHNINSGNYVGDFLASAASGYIGNVIVARTTQAAGTGFNFFAASANGVTEAFIRGDGSASFGANTDSQVAIGHGASFSDNAVLDVVSQFGGLDGMFIQHTIGSGNRLLVLKALASSGYTGSMLDIEATQAASGSFNLWIGLSGGVTQGALSGDGLLTSNRLETANPSGGTRQPWKLGSEITSTTCTLDATKYVQIDVNGTALKVATCQ